MSDPSQMRKNYMQAGLHEADLLPQPLDQFKQWFDQAVAADDSEWYEANTMTLATSTSDGVPSARIVLLKGLDKHGLIFFTNYESQKGHELAANPQAALLFFWPQLERQVRFNGVVSRMSREESAAYFGTRPRGSQLGAWASRQSQAVDSREVLEAQIAEAEKKFGPGPVVMPDYWGGYRLSPDRVEFWQGRPNRLHDRLCYIKDPAAPTGWQVQRLSP